MECGDNEKTIFCIRPHAYHLREQIINTLKSAGLVIETRRSIWLSDKDINYLYGHESPSEYYDACRYFMTRGLCEIGIVKGKEVIKSLVSIAGESFRPQDNEPHTIRAKFGENDPIEFNDRDYYLNPMHRSYDAAEAEREVILYNTHWKNRSKEDVLRDMMYQMHADKQLECVFDFHVKKVVEIATQLCRTHGGDLEIVRTASWLHDITSLKSGSKKNHHKLGAIEADYYLSCLGYENGQIKRVQECILMHRTHHDSNVSEIEADIVRSADGIANILYLQLLYFFSFKRKGLDFNTGLEAVRRKVKKSYNKISKFARPYVHADYLRIMRITQQ